MGEKIRVGNAGDAENSWKSLLRDIFVAFIPLFLLFQISTHPSISDIGRPDPNAPKKWSLDDLEEMLFHMSLKKRQEALQHERVFLEAMDGGKCYDYPTVDQPVAKKKSKRRRKFQRQSPQPKKKYNSKVKMGKTNRPMARLPAVPPSSAPWLSSLASTLRGNPPTAGRSNKGAEAKRHAINVEGHEGGKKGKKKRRIKKKFGERRKW